ncbi:MAG: primosomal protein N' [Lachnospiraceae bacterium]|nr:primosomal protein N' [Lachnospiraceae bacterium]
MKYADIIIEISSEKLDKPFQYRIPPELDQKIVPGAYCCVPFGKGDRLIKGYVVEITDKPKLNEDKIKDIDSLAVVDENNRAYDELIRLAVWMKRNYGGTLIQSLKTVLPVRASIKRKVRRTVYLNVPESEAAGVHAKMLVRHQVARARVLAALMDEDGADVSLITDKLHTSAAVITALEKLGLVRVVSDESYRKPDLYAAAEGRRVALNAEQERVTQEFIADYDNRIRKTYLLHGVTGSGKTEVYMELIAHVIASGKQAIMLIPEISLTFQTVMRFVKRFGDRVSYMHSRLSAGERYDQWERAAKGLIDIMIGPRSALFTPFSNIGIIIIDEEHESSYKAENMPRYHSRETAIERARLTGASVVLGSATPSVDAYFRAQRGEYSLWELSERAKGASLPKVHTVDMRQELLSGNRTMFSNKLSQLMERALSRHEQIMLFINRRGYAGFVSCRACGYVFKCPHCDVSLSYHRSGMLKCHYCGYETHVTKTCPKCHSKYVGGMKAGTQRIEAELKLKYPGAGILRMDADTTAKKNDYEKILKDFADEKADILIGTQMIVKGHDFPRVTLVGILAADMSLYALNYRAAERTFSLLTQAAGRAGRDASRGEVVIQTYSPDNYSVASAAQQDYNSFYRQEISYRKLMGYPPAAHMLKVLAESPDQEYCNKIASDIANLARQDSEAQTVGPSEDTIAKLNDIYRFAVYIKSEDYGVLTRIKDRIEEERMLSADSRSRVQFDFDPL